MLKINDYLHINNTGGININVTKEVYVNSMHTTMKRAVGSLVHQQYGGVIYALDMEKDNHLRLRVFDTSDAEQLTGLTPVLDDVTFLFNLTYNHTPTIIVDMVEQIESYLHSTQGGD